MSLIKSTTLEQADRVLLETYKEWASAAVPTMEELTTTVTGLKSQNYSHPFMDALDNPIPLTGERIMTDVTLKQISGICTPQGNGFEVSMLDMANGIVGPYLNLVEQLGLQAGTLKDLMIARLLDNGHNTTYTVKDETKSIVNYDGLATFSTAHVLDDGTTQQNYWSSGKELSYTNLLFAIGELMKMKASNGNPMGLELDSIVVPPALYPLAMYLANSDYISNEVSGNGVQINNIWKGKFKVVVNRYLTSSTKWFLTGTKNGVKPFAYYEYMAPWVTSITDQSAAPVFGRLKYQYGFTAVVDAQFAPYQTILALSA